jgi:hypothetical protein
MESFLQSDSLSQRDIYLVFINFWFNLILVQSNKNLTRIFFEKPRTYNFLFKKCICHLLSLMLFDSQVHRDNELCCYLFAILKTKTFTFIHSAFN